MLFNLTIRMSKSESHQKVIFIVIQKIHKVNKLKQKKSLLISHLVHKYLNTCEKGMKMIE